MVRQVKGAQGAAEILSLSDIAPKPQAAPAGGMDLEKLIVLADKGITILGRINAIMDKYGSMRMPRQAQAQATQEVKKEMKVDVGTIIGALEQIEKIQPGVTVAQLIDIIKSRPEEVQRLMDAYIGGKQ